MHIYSVIKLMYHYNLFFFYSNCKYVQPDIFPKQILSAAHNGHF